MRAFFRERARRHNSQTADPTSVVPRVRTMVLAFALLSNVVSRSNLCNAVQTAPAKSESAQATTSLAVQGAAWTGDFDEMLKRRHMRVLVASSKTQYYVVKGIQHGTSYEEMKAFEDWVNRKYPQKTKNLKFHVVFVPVSRNQFLPRLTEGRGDLAVGAITITPERAKVIDFSQPTATDVKEIAVTGPHSPELRSVDDLSGQEVFVRKDSSYWEHLEGLNQRFQSQHKPPVRLRPAPEDLEDEDLLEMLNAGLISVTITNSYLPRLWANIYRNINPNSAVVLDSAGQFAWEMRKNSPQLMKALNEFVATHKVGTAFGNSLIQRYVSSDRMLKNAIAPADLKRFQETVAFFQKYGAQYKVDHLLMMAQGFQESSLNQSAKSNVGAIGVMQLMPATGEQMKVGDIHQEEANIHAGVKYIRFMVDKYFANEPMTDTNKVLFAFASYNAGPGRIHSLRQEAVKKGLDPNIWMNNVELIAAARIGMETVTYVSNIYKYYIAYKLVAEREQERQAERDSQLKKP